MAKDAATIRAELAARRAPAPSSAPPPPFAVSDPTANGCQTAFHVEQESNPATPKPDRPVRTSEKARGQVFGKSEQLELPHSVEAERAILGCMIQAPAASIDSIKQRVPLAFFYSPAHQVMFSALLDFYDEHGSNGYKGSLDLVVLQERLRELNKLDQVGGEQAVRAYFVEAAAPSALDYHIELLEEKFLRREANAIASDLSRRAAESDTDIGPVLEQARLRVADLASAGLPKKSHLTLRTPSELMGMTFDDADNYFGDRILAAGQACTLLGPGGIGKSRLVMQLAVCMITGRAFLDMPTHGPDLRWLFVQTENSNRRLNFDLRNLFSALALTPDEIQRVNSHLFIHTIETDLDTFLDLTNPQNYAAANTLIQDVKPTFVEWDPLNSFTDKDLNSDMDMRELVSKVAQLTRTGDPNRVPLVLHHSLTGKAGAQRAVGWDKASYGRNSKVLQAWTRAQINLAPRSADDPDLLIMSCGKNNNGKPFPEIGIEFDENLGIYLKDDSFDPEEFREEVGIESKKKKTITAEDVAKVVDDGIPSLRLVQRVVERFAVSRSTAYRAIQKAVAAKIITESTVNFRAVYSRSVPYRTPYSDS